MGLPANRRRVKSVIPFSMKLPSEKEKCSYHKNAMHKAVMMEHILVILLWFVDPTIAE